MLNENRGLDRLDWLYFIDEDGQKVVHDGMEPLILGQLRAEHADEAAEVAAASEHEEDSNL